MRSRRHHHHYTPPERVRRFRAVQNLLLVLAALVTGYLAALAMMKGR